MLPDFFRGGLIRGSANGGRLQIDYVDTKAIDLQLRTFGPAITSKITSHKYAIAGTLEYSDVAPGSYLELVSTFAPKEPNGPEETTVVRTNDESGPSAKLVGTDQGHDFLLGFDTQGTPMQGRHLTSLTVNLHLAGGPCGIYFGGMKLVQYPDEAVAAASSPASAAVTPTTQSPDELLEQRRKLDNTRIDLTVQRNQATGPQRDALDAQIKDLEAQIDALFQQETAARFARDGRSLYTFGWPDWFATLPHSPKMEVSPRTWSLSLTYWGETPTDFELQRVESNIISQMQSTQFAVTGSIRYTKMEPGSYLEMLCTFAPETPGRPPPVYSVRALDEAGPMAKLEGNAVQPLFRIPFDLTGAKTHLTRVTLRLHLAGGYGTTVLLNDVHFMEFPNGHFPAPISIRVVSHEPVAPTMAAAPQPSAATTSNVATIKTTYFFLGSAATALVLLAYTLASLAWRGWQGRHKERELRRIASLDS